MKGEKIQMKEPKCPECKITGADKIAEKKAGDESIEKRLLVIYCTGCGHIYNVIADPK